MELPSVCSKVPPGGFRQKLTTPDLDVLEIGCGTGLLSFQLAPHVRSLVGVDTSDGMISAFNAKTAQSPDPTTANLAAVNVLVQSADDIHLQAAAAALARRRGDASTELPYRFNLVVSHLTLHHIPALDALLATLKDCLRPGGMLALTDYEDFGVEAIAFHPERERPGVERHGIRKADMEEVITAAGFNEVRVERAFELRKEVEAEAGQDAREMDFPFLICVAKK